MENHDFPLRSDRCRNKREYCSPKIDLAGFTEAGWSSFFTGTGGTGWLVSLRLAQAQATFPMQLCRVGEQLFILRSNLGSMLPGTRCACS